MLSYVELSLLLLLTYVTRCTNSACGINLHVPGARLRKKNLIKIVKTDKPKPNMVSKQLQNICQVHYLDYVKVYHEKKCKDKQTPFWSKTLYLRVLNLKRDSYKLSDNLTYVKDT